MDSGHHAAQQSPGVGQAQGATMSTWIQGEQAQGGVTWASIHPVTVLTAWAAMRVEDSEGTPGGPRTPGWLRGASSTFQAFVSSAVVWGEQ